MVQHPKIQDYSYEDYLDSDDEGIMYTNAGNSSDTDEEGTLCSIRRNSINGDTNSGGSGDEFEKEMAAELQCTMKKLTMPVEKETMQNAEQSSSQKSDSDKKEETEFYDAVYFDSDDSDGEKYSTKKPQPKRKLMTDDELFYDPDMDDEDQKWVDGARRKCQLKQQRLKGETSSQKLPNSDAVLNCPACFTTLCLDCQRHQIYNHQYRAMFVFNCQVDYTERLKFPKKIDKREMRKLWKQKGKSSQKSKNKSHISSLRNEEQVPCSIVTDNSSSTSMVTDSSSSTSIVTAGYSSTSIVTASSSSTSKLVSSVESPDALSLPMLDLDLPITEEVASKDTAFEELASEEGVLANIVERGSGCKDDDVGQGQSEAMSFESEGSDDVFHPVKCQVCNTKVAVYDSDEVYHFFSVLASF